MERISGAAIFINFAPIPIRKFFSPVSGSGVRSKNRKTHGVWLYFIYHSAVLYEEETLKERYGDRYAQYSSRVPRWLPSLRPTYRLNVAGRSCLEALKAEKGTAFMIIGAILLFIAKDVVDRVFLKGI